MAARVLLFTYLCAHTTWRTTWYKVGTQNRVIEPTLWASERHLCKPLAAFSLSRAGDWTVQFILTQEEAQVSLVPQHQVISSVECSYHRCEVPVPLALLGVLFCVFIPQLEKPDHEVVGAIASCNETAAVAIIL